MQPSMTERVVLVDEQDREISTEDKLEVHRQGQLHRDVQCISAVFPFAVEQRSEPPGAGRLTVRKLFTCHGRRRLTILAALQRSTCP